jgi:hypothetical protein
MNWIKVHEHLERSAINLMDHARQIGRNSPPSRFDVLTAVAMCMAELARALAAGVTEGDRLIHYKEEEGKRNNKL